MKVVAEEAQEGLNNLPQHKVPDQCPICEQFFSGGKHGVLAHLRAPTRPCAKVLKEKEEHGEMSDFPDKRYYYDRLNINMYVPIPNDKCGDCPICKKEFKYVLQHLKDSTCGIIVKNRAKNGWTDEIDNKEYYYEHLDIKEVEPTAN